MNYNYKPKNRAGKLVPTMMATLAWLFILAEADAAPGISVTTRPDVARGGRHFDIELHDINLPYDNYYLAIYLLKDGRYFSLDPYDEQIYASYRSGATPPCTFFMPGATAAGEYEVRVLLDDGSDDFYSGTVNAAEEISPWWESFTVLSKEASIFTGMMELSIRFNEVPPEVDSVTLEALIDYDGDGYGDLHAHTFTTSEDSPGVFTCSTGERKLPPLCVTDEFSSSNCDYYEPYYHFAVNGIPIRYGLEAEFQEMTRYEEGQYFGWEHYHLGFRLEEYLDLDTYIHNDDSACSYANFSSCFETGYYSKWISLYRQNFFTMMQQEGSFDATANGAEITVTAEVPMLPLGAHGFRTAVAYYPVGNPEAAIEVDIDCPKDALGETVLSDLAPGVYQLEMRVYNNHPEVIIVDYDTNDGYVFGNYLFQTMVLPNEVVVEAPKKSRRLSWWKWWKQRKDTEASPALPQSRRLIGRAPDTPAGYLELRGKHRRSHWRR